MTGWLAEERLRVAAGNLLRAYLRRESTMEGTQARAVADVGFAVLCEAGARSGLAHSVGELEVMIADVVEQLPPAGAQRSVDGGADWTWLMQARFILARRLGAGPSAVAA